jgi:RHS repeat-associated protein
VEYYHLDALGSIRAVTDENGGILTRHDYYPYGKEWNEPPSNDTRRFTGKERDTETELDYFGARYYGAGIAIFTAVDPAMTSDANVVDPQRWNRYMYGRSSPLRFVDSTGLVLELVGDNKEASFALIQRMVGTQGAELLYTRQEAGRTLVDYRGRESNALRRASMLGFLVADVIDEQETAQLSINHDPSEVVTTRFESCCTIAYYGGGATSGADASYSGNAEVRLARNAGAIATQAMNNWVGRARSDNGTVLRFSDVGVLAHELGHALGNLRGGRIYMSAETDKEALRWENNWRASRGHTNRRVREK